jgi:hypothetical protein
MVLTVVCYKNNGQQILENHEDIMKRKQNVVLTLLHNGAQIFSDEEKVDVIAQKFSESHLLTVNQTNTTDINQKVTEKIAEIQGGQPVEVYGDDLTSPNEIKSIFERLGSRKTPGPDGINKIVVKNLPRKAVIYQTYIFNACIKK